MSDGKFVYGDEVILPTGVHGTVIEISGKDYRIKTISNICWYKESDLTYANWG